MSSPLHLGVGVAARLVDQGTIIVDSPRQCPWPREGQLVPLNVLRAQQFWSVQARHAWLRVGSAAPSPGAVTQVAVFADRVKCCRLTTKLISILAA